MNTLAQIIVQETTDDNGCLVPSVPVYILGTDVSLDAELGPSEDHIGEVGGHTIASNVTLTRPTGTDIYSAKDSISDSTSAPSVLTFSDVARVTGGSGYITKARLTTNQSTNAARYRLHIYHTSPTAINDNAQFTLLWANRANCIGYIDFDACQTEGTGSDAAQSLNTTVRLAFTCDTGSKALYGQLETLDGFTPASGQVYYIELSAENN